jgi:hypothetical protein
MAVQPAGIKRTDHLQRRDLSVPGQEVVQNRVYISSEAPAIKHRHPGEEVIYVLEGRSSIRSRAATDDPQSWRCLDHSSWSHPRGEERRQRQRGGTGPRMSPKRGSHFYCRLRAFIRWWPASAMSLLPPLARGSTARALLRRRGGRPYQHR